MNNNDLNQPQNTGYNRPAPDNQNQHNPDPQYETDMQYEETPQPDEQQNIPQQDVYAEQGGHEQQAPNVEENQYTDPALQQSQKEVQYTDQDQLSQIPAEGTVYDDAQNLPLNMNDTQIQEMYPGENVEEQSPVQDKGVDFSTAINNLEPNVAAALSYLLTPFTGILIFLTTPKEKQFVKFHSFQSILFGLVAIGAISISRSVPYISYLLNSVVNVAIGFLWLFLLWKAFNNEAYELPIIGKFAKDQVRN